MYIFEKGSVLQAARPVLQALDPGAVLVAAAGNLYDTKLPDEIDKRYAGPWSGTIDEAIAYDPIPISAAGRAMNGRAKAEILEAIRQQAAGCSLVVVATDDDREGDKIGWDIVEHCLDWAGPVRRMRPRAATPDGIRAAHAEMLRLPDGGALRSYCGALEARARQHADWHIGINGTRQASVRLRPHGMKGVLHYGPVLMPTLDILAERELEIRNFKPRDYFKLRLDVVNKKGLKVSLVHDPEPRLFDRAPAEAILNGLMAWPGGEISAVTKPRKIVPPDLFNLDAMQLAAGRRLGLSPADTLKFAQELYDKGFISYPRGTGTTLPQAEAAIAERVVAATAGHHALAEVRPDALIKRPAIYREEKTDAGGETAGPAHFAVAPTTTWFDRGAVTDMAAALYEMIARRFIANHMPDARDEVTTLSTEVDGRRYAAYGTIEREAGWRVIEPRAGKPRKVSRRATEGDDKPDAEGRLPPFVHGEAIVRADAAIVETRTQAPRRITLGELPTIMAKLIDWVEDPALKAALRVEGDPDNPKGLGTPATRSRIVDTLIEAGYVAKLKPQGKAKDPPLECLELGLGVRQGWRDAWPCHCDPVRRAQTEHGLALIGQAATRAEAVRHVRAWKEGVRAEVDAMVAALRGARALRVAGYAAKPTAAMIKFAESLIARHGLAAPEGLHDDAGVCKAFLDAHAPRSGGPSPGGDGPTPAQLALAEKLAAERNVAIPPKAKASKKEMSAWIDSQIKAPRPAPGKAPAVAGFSRRPSGPATRPATSRP